MTTRGPTWTYTTPTATCSLDIPRLPAETFEDWLIRTAPMIRDGLGIKPAPEMDKRAWLALRDRARAGAGSA